MNNRIFSKTKNKIPIDIQKQLRSPSGDSGLKVGKEMYSGNAELIDKCISYIKSDTNKLDICDIGCGPGYSLDKLSEVFKDANIVGIDSSETMLSILSKKYENTNSRVRIINSSLPNLQIEDNQFDYVLLINVIYFLENLTNSIKEIKRILKPSGMLIIYMTDGKSLQERINKEDGVYINIDVEKVKQELEDLNFQDINTDTFKRNIGQIGHIITSLK